MNFQRFFKFLVKMSLLGLISSILIVLGTYIYLLPEMPDIEDLRDVHFQVPLRIYTKDEKLIAEYGEKRRTPVEFEDIPDAFIKALLAAEDQSFFEHSGVDYKGLTRAVKLMVQNKGSIKGGGGSTITMQLTRALFLTKERKFKRKFKEIFLSYKIENELSKQEILELYCNQIYLGKRAYGIQAAANVYYNKNIDQLSIAQLAMIAGLPKAPATNNPVNRPEKALKRRNWVLSRMHELKFISQEQYQQAVNEPDEAKDYGQSSEVDAPYIAEMIRQQLFDQYGEEIYTEGYVAHASILSKEQLAANKAVIEGIHAYDERHGYKGPVKHAEIPELEALWNTYQEQLPLQTFQSSQIIQNIMKDSMEHITLDKSYNFKAITAAIEINEIDFSTYFEDVKKSRNLEAAICIRVDEENKLAVFVLSDKSIAIVHEENTLWAIPYIDNQTVGAAPEKISQVLTAGDLTYLRKIENDEWRLSQLPEVQSALVALNPTDGAVIALVGGYDYSLSKYNRAIQGGRQIGSSFKPFIYTKALESGFTAATIINDAPIVFEDSALEEKWKPENSGGRFYGPTRFRQALYLSRNLVSIRVLSKVGIGPTIDSMERFGFDKTQLPNNLSLALGSASLTPMQVTTGFSTFANGGYRIYPYFLESAQNGEGETIYKANPIRVCPDCPEENTDEENPTTAEKENAQDLDQNMENPASKSDETLAIDEEEEIKIRPAKSVIEPRVNYIMDSILADVINRGTGTAAQQLKRNDMRGKTGTTNDQFDAWFTGYNGNIVASSWIGFDTPQTLGRGEYGAVAALPVWLSFMNVALENAEEKTLPRPDRLVTVKINAETGEAAKPGDPNSFFEIFREEFAPKLDTKQESTSSQSNEIEPGQIF